MTFQPKTKCHNCGKAVSENEDVRVKYGMGNFKDKEVIKAAKEYICRGSYSLRKFILI